MNKLKLQKQMSLGAFDAIEDDPELFQMQTGMEAIEHEDQVGTSLQFGTLLWGGE